MKTLKFLSAGILAMLMTSCVFEGDWGQTRGNGNVVTETRDISEHFTGVRGSAGLDVYLEKGSETKVVVEADENLHDLIITEVNNGFLKIRTRSNISRAKAKKVYVTYTELDALEASSGADVIANSVVKAEKLSLSSSSGADLEVEIDAREVTASTSSGADLKVFGRAKYFTADASSGSDLNAKELSVQKCRAEATSGADITVNVREDLDARASSGGDIRYYGNPTSVNKKDGHSGGIRKM